MKKQFCLLLIAVFAISFSNSYGQALPGSAPRGTKCVDDALHPIAGKPYDYVATGAVAGVNRRLRRGQASRGTECSRGKLE
jgi:hypothetical protein